MNVAIIPARGGSRRILRKNIRPFHGKPIIAYAIQVALDSRLFRDVYVSTEDQEIADIAKVYGALVSWRPSALAVDEVGTQEVTRAALISITAATGAVIDKENPAHVLGGPDKITYACCIYPCVPLLTPELLLQAYELLQAYGDYVVPCGHWLKDPGQFYFGRARAFLEDRPLLGPYTRLMPIPAWAAVDINIEGDWQEALRKYAELHERQVNERGNV